MMKYLLILCLLFILPDLKAQVEIKIPDTRNIQIKRNDTLEVISILMAKDKIIKPDNNLTYYWYAFQKVHKNQGAYSGTLLHGDYKVFDKENRMIEQGLFTYGLKTGRWLYWDKWGNIVSEYNWKSGNLHGISKHFQNRQLIRSEQYKNGKLHGHVIIYNHNGEKQLFLFKDGVLKKDNYHITEKKAPFWKRWKKMRIEKQEIPETRDVDNQVEDGFLPENN